MTLANLLTLSRLAFAVVIFVTLEVLPAGPLLLIPFALLIFAGITDVFDGFVARRMNSVTEFGRVADAFIDRILICGCFVVFVDWRLVPVWVALVVVIREFLIGGIRNLADTRGLKFQATIFGKTKFATQFAACAAVILYRSLFEGVGWARIASDVVVYASAVNTILSGVVYLANYKRLVGSETP
jgi:CDP-diacylglycerol--glycerol-3-phosphate 3-phosphatidyltransferase